MSLKHHRQVLGGFSIVSASRRCSGSSLVSISTPAMPITPCSGVWISCHGGEKIILGAAGGDRLGLAHRQPGARSRSISA